MVISFSNHRTLNAQNATFNLMVDFEKCSALCATIAKCAQTPNQKNSFCVRPGFTCFLFFSHRFFCRFQCCVDANKTTFTFLSQPICCSNSHALACDCFIERVSFFWPFCSRFVYEFLRIFRFVCDCDFVVQFIFSEK